MVPEIDRLANRQFGLVTTGQLRDIGRSDRQIEWAAHTGELIVVRGPVFRMAGAPIVWEQAIMAVVLSTRPPIFISHTTSAALRALRHSDRYAAGIHLTSERQVRLSGVTAHRCKLAADECTQFRGIPVTTPERTIMDLAGILTVKQLGECVDDALRRRLIRLDRLRAVVDRAAASKHGRRLLAPMHTVLADRIEVYRPDDSDFETRMNAEWVRLGLPRAEKQYRVRCGNRTYRLDVALPDAKVGVEWESLRYHGTRSGMDGDSDRRADLTADGWVILSFTWNSSPERIARAVCRLCRDRGANVAAA